MAPTEPQNVSRAFVESSTNSSGVRNKRFLEDKKVAVEDKKVTGHHPEEFYSVPTVFRRPGWEEGEVPHVPHQEN